MNTYTSNIYFQKNFYSFKSLTEKGYFQMDRSCQQEERTEYLNFRENSSSPCEDALSPFTQHSGSYRNPEASQAV